MDTNSTMPESSGPGNSIQGEAAQYFIFMWPLMVSTGLGGCVLGVLYAVINYIWE
jgi:hypothetical protein